MDARLQLLLTASSRGMFGLGRKLLKAAEKNCLKSTCRPRRRRDCQQRRRQLQLCRPPLSPRELQSHEHFFPLFRAPEHLQPPELSRRIKYALQSLTKVTMTQLHPLARRAMAAASTSSLPDITSASVWLTALSIMVGDSKKVLLKSCDLC